MSPMSNPPHPGETIRFECIQAAGLTVTEAARRLGCSRPTLSRVLNGRAVAPPGRTMRTSKSPSATFPALDSGALVAAPDCWFFFAASVSAHAPQQRP